MTNRGETQLLRGNAIYRQDITR